MRTFRCTLSSGSGWRAIGMVININRRAFLAYTAALAGAASSPTRSAEENIRTRLIPLGTGGGPRPRKANAPSAQAIVANATAYVIDCGNGAARQLALAGVPLA